MLDLTTEQLILIIKAISPTYPKIDRPLTGDITEVYHRLFLEIDRREQRALFMTERFEKIAAIRKENKRKEEEERAAMRAEYGEYYSAADEMIMEVLNELIADN